ncbi:diguanylate cyclase [Marinobacterium lacunae]|uniref:Diguanylate cyclase n=1 Tax=Marinobacterium lacunae TaxID=1232683 RepID=A0A081G4I8_9GAMM|nr:EAL domain-containing protein [Marinobacterium lacunae]KEA65693.1 diguanylate cyclase [Marinobacterium lacunae]
MIWNRIFVVPLIGVVLCACFIAIYFVFQAIGESRARVSIASESVVLAHTLESGLVRSIQDVQGRLNSLRSQLEYTEDLFFVPDELQRRLSALIEMSPQLRELAVVSPEGLVLGSSQEGAIGKTAPGLSCLAEGDTHLPMLFGRALAGRSLTETLAPAGVYQLPICMPLFKGAGNLVAWIVAVWNPDAVRAQFRPLIEQLPLSLQLMSYDGRLMVAEPAEGVLPGYSLGDQEPFRSRLAEREWGSFEVEGNGREYLVNYRATSLYPVVLTLKYDLTEGLTYWRQLMSKLRWLVTGIVAMIFVATGFMVRQFKREQQMADRLQLLGTAISTTANAVIITDREGVVQWVNRAFTQLTGYEPEQVVGRTPAILNSGEHPKAFFHELWNTISSGRVWRGEVVNRTRAGGRLIVDQTITPIRSDNLEIDHFVAVHEDVTARREAEQRALFLAFHDQLTELPNRRRLTEKLGEALQLPDQRDIGLLYIDLDNFKTVNDTLGHGMGDELLVITVRRLTNAVSDDICLARLGGDEFAMLVTENVDKSWLEELAARLIKVLAQPVELKGTRFQLSASIGVAIGTSGEAEPATLLRQADLAMYKAKHDGRNLYRFFDVKMDYLMRRRVDLEQGLRVAMSGEGELSMRYQPIFDANTLRPLGLEVLLRWQNEAGEWISPAEFVPVAEESGMIVQLGAWQMEEVISQLATWDAEGLEVGYLSVNVSAVQLARDDIAGRLLHLLARYHISTDRIVVEITETTLMSKAPLVKSNLAALEAAGVCVSIDDFGTGYSSLSYLKELQADYLKIDRSFVVGIGKNRSDEEIINAMLALARSLQMRVVAEGVDDASQLRFLQNAGCDLIQGYLLSRPLTNLDAAQLFDRARNGLTVLAGSA